MFAGPKMPPGVSDPGGPADVVVEVLEAQSLEPLDQLGLVYSLQEVEELLGDPEIHAGRVAVLHPRTVAEPVTTDMVAAEVAQIAKWRQKTDGISTEVILGNSIRRFVSRFCRERNFELGT